MTREELVKETVKRHYSNYNIRVPFDKLPWSGELIETKLNDGTIELVDRLVEFTLCALYSFYFIDRYCFTLDPQKGPIPLKLFPFQKKILDDFQNHRKTIFRKCRQIGASVITGCYALWRANFHKAQIIKIISLQLEDAKEFKEKTIDVNYYEMPGFLKTKTTRDGYSKTRLKLVNQSNLRVLPKSKNAGRGGTPSLVIIDEAAFNEWMDDIWKSIEPSLDKGGDLVVISTTNGVGNWYHLAYTKAEAGLNEFHTIFVPWWKYPGRDNPWLEDIQSGKIPAEEVEDFIKQKEFEQLDYKGPIEDAPWLFKKRANAKNERDFQQEILASFLGSGDTVITPKTIERLEASARDPICVDRLLKDPKQRPIPGLWVWKDVVPEHMYMLTADTATGHGKDFSTCQIIDIYQKEQVAEYKNQEPTDKFGMIIKKIARYYNEAYVVIETNHPGPAVFNEVYTSRIDPYFNVYVKKKGRALISWETSPKTRVLLIEDYFKDTENAYTIIYSRRLIEEIKVFQWGDSGKPEALSGYNDDLVIAYAMYTHLKDKVFASRPLGISSSQTKSLDVKSEIDDVEWSNRSDKVQEIVGIDLETYYWLTGSEMPDTFKKYVKSERQKETDELRGEINLERPPEWLLERIRKDKE